MLRALSIAVVAVVLAGCGGSSGGHTTGRDADAPPATASSTSCTAPPPPVASVTVPSEPPMPAGTYGITSPDTRVALVVTGSPTEFAHYVLTTWAAQGWTLGHGDAERGEAEDDFAKGTVRGHFWAQARYCGHSEVLLQFASS